MNFALFVTMLSYRQKLEKAQLVVIHKITQSLHPTLPFIFFLFLLFFSLYTVKANMLLLSAEKDASRTTYEVIWKNFTRFVRRVWQAVFIQFSLKFGCRCILCMSSIEHLLCILYMYIYMHNIYIMYGITVCCLHAVLWIAIPGQRAFFFFACLLAEFNMCFKGFYD